MLGAKYKIIVKIAQIVLSGRQIGALFMVSGKILP